MRFFLLLAMLAAAMPASAEDPIVATPLPPLDATQPPVAPPQTAWLPKTTASVQALDKVNARGSVLTIEVGQSAMFGSLTIAVKACGVRPADAPADATAFLIVTDKNPDAPSFSGWMLKSTPAVSMLEHPIYDVRVVGCT